MWLMHEEFGVVRVRVHLHSSSPCDCREPLTCERGHRCPSFHGVEIGLCSLLGVLKLKILCEGRSVYLYFLLTAWKCFYLSNNIASFFIRRTRDAPLYRRSVVVIHVLAARTVFT